MYFSAKGQKEERETRKRKKKEGERKKKEEGKKVQSKLFAAKKQAKEIKEKR